MVCTRPLHMVVSQHNLYNPMNFLHHPKVCIRHQNKEVLLYNSEFLPHLVHHKMVYTRHHHRMGYLYSRCILVNWAHHLKGGIHLHCIQELRRLGRRQYYMGYNLYSQSHLMDCHQVCSHRSHKEVANYHNELNHIRCIHLNLLVYKYLLDLHILPKLEYRLHQMKYQ